MFAAYVMDTHSLGGLCRQSFVNVHRDIDLHLCILHFVFSLACDTLHYIIVDYTEYIAEYNYDTDASICILSPAAEYIKIYSNTAHDTCTIILC